MNIPVIHSYWSRLLISLNEHHSTARPDNITQTSTTLLDMGRPIKPVFIERCWLLGSQLPITALCITSFSLFPPNFPILSSSQFHQCSLNFQLSRATGFHANGGQLRKYSSNCYHVGVKALRHLPHFKRYDGILDKLAYRLASIFVYRPNQDS